MRVESPSSPRERRSVYTVRRLIISMRDSNFIKKDEKHIPHFRRTELFPSGGGKPEGKEGEQYSHVRDVHPVLISEHAVLSERVLHEFTYNSETSGDPGLTPSPLVSTRSSFGNEGAKPMSGTELYPKARKNGAKGGW